MMGGMMAVALWMGPPRSFTSGRPRPIQYIVIHYTAGSEGPTSAEAGIAYDKVRTDGTSTHVFVDSNTVCREVWDVDQAHAARRTGNRIGLQMEICGTAQTREQWLDKYSLPTLQLAAKQAAEWCRAHSIPVRRLSVAETRAAWYAPDGQRPKGFVGHVDVTMAYPEDNGDHTDPGPQFPWDVFLDMVRAELGQATEDDMGLYCKLGDQNDNVWRLQIRLEMLGFAPPNTIQDGKYGPKTAATLKAALATVNWNVDGNTYSRGEDANLDVIWARHFGSGGEIPAPVLVPHNHSFSVTVTGSGSGTSGPAQPTK